MKKKRTVQKQRTPAKAVAKHPEVLTIEQPLREWFLVQKRFIEDGPDAALAVISGLIDDRTDPSSASMGAIASAQLLDSGMFDHDLAQEGRSRGGNQRAKDIKAEAGSGLFGNSAKSDPLD